MISVKTGYTRKDNRERGITLVALIITIIILVILAAVTIDQVFDLKIVETAINGTQNYTEAQIQEKEDLDDISKTIADAVRKTEIVEIKYNIGKEIKDLEKENNRNITDEELKEILEKYGTLSEEGEKIEDKTLTTNKGGYELKVSDILKGPVEEAPDKPIVAEKPKIEIKRNGMTIKISGTGTGIERFRYTISPVDGIPEGKSEGTFKANETIEIETTKIQEYTVIVVAEDSEGNTIEVDGTKKITPEDGGVDKYIKIAGEGRRLVNTKEIYGADVKGYTCSRTDAEWQIFYIDEEDNDRVYLIAKDYMAPPVNNAEPKLIKGNSENYPKGYGFEDTMLVDYTGTIPRTDFTEKFLSEFVGEEASTQINLQATKYMLSQEIWAEYNGEKADYAFGGPTLPLFQSSYNDICKVETKLGIQKEGKGYKINQGGGKFDWMISGYGNTETQKGMYFVGNRINSAYGTYLASPSSGESAMVVVTHDGYVNNLFNKQQRFPTSSFT